MRWSLIPFMRPIENIPDAFELAATDSHLVADCIGLFIFINQSRRIFWFDIAEVKTQRQVGFKVVANANAPAGFTFDVQSGAI